MHLLSTITALLLATAVPALAADSIAQVKDRAGNLIGTTSFATTPSGMVVITIDLKNISPGKHGVHVHETGDCSAADFKSAGGHLSGERNHGVLVEGGPHPGDLPNVMVGEDGLLQAEFFNTLLNPTSEGEAAMFDADGSAFIVHSGPDDYESQPSGNAGDRIACGVIEPSKG